MAMTQAHHLLIRSGSGSSLYPSSIPQIANGTEEAQKHCLVNSQMPSTHTTGHPCNALHTAGMMVDSMCQPGWVKGRQIADKHQFWVCL